jgi:hypothetical protein
MSIQLEVISARELFGEALRCTGDLERQHNFSRFEKILKERCRSCALDFGRFDEAAGRTFDFFIREVEVLFDVVEREFPDLRKTMESYVYIPVSDPKERLYFEFPLICEGKQFIWAVSDINSLRDLLHRITQFNKTQQDYDSELLSSALRNYAEAIPVAEREKFLIFYSH